MSERVHPRDTDSPPVSGERPPRSTSYNRMHRHTMIQDSSSQSNHSTTPSSGTYVIQIPKDQIYRVPPPENAYKQRIYKNSRRRRRTCRQCCCATFCLLLVLLALLVAAAGVFYLTYHPKAPSFSVDRVSIRGVDVSASSSAASATISPDFNVTIRSENPNGVVGFYYEPGSAVAVYHDDLKLCGGALPAFYQAPRNVTVLSTVLLGGQIVVSSDVKQKLAEQQKNGSVPLRMSVGLPVKVRVGVVTTWKVTVKAVCDVVVSALTAQAEVVSKDCSVDFRPW